IPRGRRDAPGRPAPVPEIDQTVGPAARDRRYYCPRSGHAAGAAHRSVADAANVIDDFDKKGIQLVSIGEGFDMTHAYGRAMAQTASVFAELERAMIRERTRSAMSVKRKRGERISGYEPFGWDFGPKGRLVENAREQKIIARMRRMQAEGMSFRGIGVRLDEEG